MAHQPSTTIPKEWAPQSWKIEESMQTKMLNGRMKNARRELLTLERQLGMIHEMSLDDLKQFVDDLDEPWGFGKERHASDQEILTKMRETGLWKYTVQLRDRCVLEAVVSVCDPAFTLHPPR